MKLHQFYYTNYGRGYRIEASSLPDLDSAQGIVSAISAAAGIWERSPAAEGAETVSYAERIGRYLAARTVPCRQPGDTRPGFWSHVILPASGTEDSFAACLSWPADRYRTQVSLGEKLADITASGKDYDRAKICQKYGLEGERLSQLLLLVLRTVSGAGRGACLVHTDRTQAVHCESAREMMAVIYRMLPAALAHRAGYQSLTDHPCASLYFHFCRAGSGEADFSLDPASPARPEADPLAREMGRDLAETYLSDPARYRQLADGLCRDPGEDFETLLWNYYRQLDPARLKALDQGLLLAGADRLLQAAAGEEAFLPLLEDWFSAVRMDAQDPGLSAFTELSLREAVLLKETGSKGYSRCVLRCRRLLRELSGGEETFQENLRIIGGQYPSIAGDIHKEKGQEEEDGPAKAGTKKKTGRKRKPAIQEDNFLQRTVASSFLFAGFYLALIVSVCSWFTQLAREMQQPLVFAGGMAAVIAGSILLMVLNALTGWIKREHHITISGIFMAGILVAAVYGFLAVAGSEAATLVSAAGTIIFGIILARR